jgi:hypothetical protein
MPRPIRLVSEVVLWTLIALVALVNLAVYTNVVRGADPDSAPRARTATAVARVSGTATPQPGPDTCPSRAPLEAELDDSDSLPGRFVPSQGCLHTGAWPLRSRVPFCDQGNVHDNCYASNPPTSGLHLPVQGTVQLPDGGRMKLPPDPGVYDTPVPREAIPHIEEHGGVYAGYNCASSECESAAAALRTVVEQQNALGWRVVLSPDPDLPSDTLALAAWTRVDSFAAEDYSDERATRFIRAHSCRFDPEQFCRNRPLN